MHPRSPFPVASLLLLAASAGPLLAQNPTRQTPSTSFGTISVAEAAVKIRALIDQPAPPEMSPVDLKAYQSQTEWLKRVATRLDKVNHEVVSPRDASSGQASGKRVSAVLSPDVDLLKKQIEEETQRFTLLDNVLRARHQAAMNAIRNMR